jgi:hypothetical protein
MTLNREDSGFRKKGFVVAVVAWWRGGVERWVNSEQ